MNTSIVDQDKASLVDAIKSLFSINQYDIEGPKKFSGAEVDLEAKSKLDVFSPPIFIEATEQFVDNTKYGKDCTKFIALRELFPSAQMIIVSSKGFTPDVEERDLPPFFGPLLS
jgi:hypothetical protein